MSANPNLTELLTVALSAASPLAAGLVERQRNAINIDTKSSAVDLVTDSDRWCEEQLVSAILARRPNDGLLGEEGAARPGTSGVRWIIDPIDGTTNFVHGLAGFSISVAAEVDGVVSAGVVVDPIRRETFTAIRGGGAQRNGRPLQCSAKTDLRSSLVCTGFSYDDDLRSAQAQQLLTVLPAVRDIRRLGGAAVELCHVAAGRLDAYYEAGLHLWDVAAGGLVALEAGALLTDFSGATSWDDRILCCGVGLHDELIALLDH